MLFFDKLLKRTPTKVVFITSTLSWLRYPGTLFLIWSTLLLAMLLLYHTTWLMYKQTFCITVMSDGEILDHFPVSTIVGQREWSVTSLVDWLCYVQVY